MYNSGQRTGVIDAKPAVKIQSAYASPGIDIPPRAVVQEFMPDDGSMVSGDEEVNKENESWEDDDEINHEKLLWMKIHNLRVHFSYITRLLLLHEHCATAKCATIKVQLDLNDTRVAAQHGSLSDYQRA